MLKSKKAFTLAEVLITLAIIGILAAVLIPRTLNNINSESAHAKFRNTYVQIQKGLKIAKENYKESLFELKKDSSSETDEHFLTEKVDKYMKAHFNVKVAAAHPAIGDDGRTYQFPSGAQLLIPEDTLEIMAGGNNANGPGCEVTTTLSNKCVMYIDINGGAKKPNITLGTVNTSSNTDTPTDSTGACKTGTQYAINTEIHKHVFNNNVPACEVPSDVLFDIYPIVFEEDDLKPYSNAVAYVLENKNENEKE